MSLLLLFAAGCCAGFFLFRRKVLPRAQRAGPAAGDGAKLSVIIPARNEERNLPHLLASLRDQTRRPDEIIVVDDGSEDGTRRVAESFGVRVIECPPLPPGWTGKTWAVWNGYKHAGGDVLVFLDADVRLAPQALECLIAAREASGGVLSVVPFHTAERWYERLAMVTNILGVFVFTSPFEARNPRQGLYGSCIVAHRTDYEKVGGHESIRSELMDDLSLGAQFKRFGVPVANYLGAGLVSFRMYPDGLRSQLEGFGKAAVPSLPRLTAGTLACVVLWTAGLVVSSAAALLWWTPHAVPLLCGYALYTLQIAYLNKYTGSFGRASPLLHVFSAAFFLVILAYSAYRAVFFGRMRWRGRTVEIGGRLRR